MNKEKEISPQDIRCRVASISDLNALVGICRQCFPYLYRWQSLYSPIAKNWWREVLKSKSCITIVLEDSIGIFGLNVLVLDLKLWAKEKKQRDGSFVRRIVSILFCPYPEVWKRLWKNAMVRKSYTKPVEKQSKIYPEKTAWSEMQAVLTRRRKQGLATIMVEERHRLAIEAGMKYIQSHTDSDNIAARRMIEKGGWKLIKEDHRGCLYEKTLV